MTFIHVHLFFTILNMLVISFTCYNQHFCVPFCTLRWQHQGRRRARLTWVCQTKLPTILHSSSHRHSFQVFRGCIPEDKPSFYFQLIKENPRLCCCSCRLTSTFVGLGGLDWCSDGSRKLIVKSPFSQSFFSGILKTTGVVISIFFP